MEVKKINETWVAEKKDSQLRYGANLMISLTKF